MNFFSSRKFLSVPAFLVFGSALALAATATHWEHIPAKDHARVNPLAGKSEAASAGGLVYADHCAQCHKSDAAGDGKKRPALRNEHLRSASDGDLEWFLRQGDLRNGMPSWSSLPQAQRWQLVTYLRSIQ